MVAGSALSARLLKRSPASPGAALRLEWGLTALVILALTASLSLSGALHRLDAILYDGLVRAMPRTASDQVVIVAIDDPSLAEVGPWPWPRARHAELIDRLAAAQPRVIAYDILFPEPSADPADDAALARALQRFDRAVLPVHLETPGPDGADHLLRLPAPGLAEAAAGLGHVNLNVDPDGVVRRVRLAETLDGRPLPHLSSVAVSVAEGAPSAPPSAGPVSRLKRGQATLIPFAGPSGHVATFSAAQVLRGEAPTDLLRGRYVLIGVSASGVGDRYPTPTTSATTLMPGVEIIAHALAGQLEGRFIRPLPPWAALLFSLTPVIALLAALRRLAPRRTLLLGLGLAALTLAASLGLLAALRVFAPPSAGLAGLGLLLPLWAWRRLAATSRYLDEELARFARTPDLLPPPQGPMGDVVSSQIDALKAAIARAETLRELTTTTLQSLPDPAFVLDNEGGVTFANAAGHELFPDPIGARFQPLLNGWRDAPQDDPSVAPEMIAPDGRRFQTARVDLNGEDTRTATVVRLVDVTSLRAAAAQRERVLQFLTHDLRSPQISILALLQTGGGLPDASTTDRISAYAEQTLALAESYVSLARAEAGELSLEPLDLGDLLTQTVDDLWPQARSRDVVIRCDNLPEAPVLGDRALLGRAIDNLIGNALRHSPPGASIDTHILATDDGFTVEIADRGPGLSPEALERIFSPFRRGETESGAASGAGLGLALVSEVARRHRGAAFAAQRPDGGAIFSLRLPRAT